eukprot:9531860-Ditylum_brightwellii.AAC.1
MMLNTEKKSESTYVKKQSTAKLLQQLQLQEKMKKSSLLVRMQKKQNALLKEQQKHQMGQKLHYPEVSWMKKLSQQP